MIESLVLILIAAAILVILFFAYTTKNKLASYVAYIILAAIALSMALNGLVGLISGVDFLSFLVDILNMINSIIIFVELGLIIYLVFISKLKNKNTILKVTIIVYVVLSLLVEFNVLG